MKNHYEKNASSFDLRFQFVLSQKSGRFLIRIGYILFIVDVKFMAIINNIICFSCLKMKLIV